MGSEGDNSNDKKPQPINASWSFHSRSSLVPRHLGPVKKLEKFLRNQRLTQLIFSRNFYGIQGISPSRFGTDLILFGLEKMSTNEVGLLVRIQMITFVVLMIMILFMDSTEATSSTGAMGTTDSTAMTQPFGLQMESTQCMEVQGM